MTRVLVVDDKEDNVYYLTMLLGANGYSVEAANHGAEALLKARQNVPDLIISDLLMPVMDGYTLLRLWKSDARLRLVPFIVYTATYTDPEDERLALNLGADAFVLKPSEPEEFIARIQEVLARVVAVAPAAHEPIGPEEERLKEYSETLIRKLEHKTLQLEESNRILQRDIAARELAELALRESEARFRQLADNIEDVFWLSDPIARATFYVSPAYQQIWGRTAESLYASPSSWLDAVHPEDREHLEKSLPTQVLGKWEETFRIARPDGAIRWIRSRAYPVRDAAGRVYRVAGVSRDITSYRALEEQFRQAQKMEAVGQLAGGVAHDFNNLLSVILSYTSLILSDLAPGDPLRSDVEEVRRAGVRATDLTRQLLAFGRQQMLQPQVVDLGVIVGTMHNMLRRLLGESVELVLQIEQSTRPVFADPSQIEQIVMNLVINARDAMPRGGTITVEVREVDFVEVVAEAHIALAPGRYVMLVVSDNGFGMSAATRQRIFEPFFTTKERGKGTGLGLSTVFGIVTQSNGHIHVYSEPDLGTTFRVYLPCTTRVPDRVPPPRPAPVTLSGSETILLVEDDPQVCEINRTILRRNGYRVLEATNGVDAVALSEGFAEPIDLLLTDVVMPKMGGRELAERIGPARPAMKVLYVSGYAESAIVHHGLIDEGIALLEKPTLPDTLLRKVREVLDGAPRRP